MVQSTSHWIGQAQGRKDSLPAPIRGMSERVKIIRFGIVRESTRGAWSQLAGMFRVGRPVNVEEMLDDTGALREL
jgi:hypothetical protein